MVYLLEQASARLNHWVRALVCTMGMAMAGIVAAQVFYRYGLNRSLFWSEELARFLLVWLTFFGATVAYYHKAHPGVDGLVRRLPKTLQLWSRVLVHGAGLVLFSVMVGSGAQFAWFVRLQITPALHLPKWIVMAVVPLAGLVFMIHGITFLFQTLATILPRKKYQRPG